ncbi:Plasmodium vivax Vir protein, putative [Plasmodium vivax]|uniref:Vir protein, putative n=1 Tax=Plasmodium vivax TaxID=5855 RepID=A0A1G4EB80_PLAVI|nr:Plasmodium vivax Vir protein, putative [Plasmodium vivax]
MRKHLTESDSNNFTSNIMYYKFESGQGDCKDVPFDSEVRDELENHPNLRNISDKIAKALCYVYWKKVYNESSKAIAGSIAPVLGVSSFSLLLYKVTPVGGFINRLLGRNRNMYNPVEYMDSFNPYSDGMDPGSRGVNISYHRI